MSSDTEGTEVLAVMTVDDSHLFSQSLYVDLRAVVVLDATLMIPEFALDDEL